jgi:hypothetical protein
VCAATSPRFGATLALYRGMGCRRCVRVPVESPPVAAEDPDAPCDGHPPTALETLRRTVSGRSIVSAEAASDEPADAPIRAAWIIG